MTKNLNASLKIDGKYYTISALENSKIKMNITDSGNGYIYRKTELYNSDGKNSPEITEIYTLDHTFKCENTAYFYSLRGDDDTKNSFLPIEKTIEKGEEFVLAPIGGRPSNTTAFPYFDLTLDGKPILFAVGWAGQWKAIIKRTTDGVNVKIGMENADFYMLAGAKLNLPSCCVMTGECGEDAPALRRRFRKMLATDMNPLPDGVEHLPISVAPYDRYFYGKCPDWPTVDGQLRTLKATQKCKYFDTFWIDAAWFRLGFPDGVGNYTFAEGFPDGLRPVADAVHEAGMRFMVWFEPERIHSGSEIFENHKDFLLSVTGEKDTFLYNLGDETAFSWLKNTLINFIRDNGIDNYRQDFNMEPLPYWLQNDQEGRRGITEIRYVNGLYKLWDSLLDEFPNLLIDNCASGGRRLDFELTRRSVPLWRSDINCAPVKPDWHCDVWNQNQTLTLSEYLPYHACGAWELNTFELRSAATSGIACDFDLLNENYDFERACKMLCELKNLSKYWKGDFYPLTKPTTDENVFAAFQLAEEDAGFALIFRRADCEEADFVLKLEAIDENADYKLLITDNDYNTTEKTVSGSVLKSGITVILADARTSAVCEYFKTKN